MSKSRSILGIDLRVNSVKVVEIEQRKDGVFLKNWGLTEVPYSLVDKHPQKQEAQAETLRQLILTRKIKSKNAVVVVGGGEVHVRLLTLAGVSRAELAEVIKWKFAEEITFPVEEAIFDFYPLPRSAAALDEKNDYIAACISRQLYQEIEQIIHQAGLNLAAITILPDALQKVFEFETHRGKDKIISLMYMGKRTTNISILKDRNLEFNRELSIGGENITLAMCGMVVSDKGKVEINPEKAEEIKLEYGIPLDCEKSHKFADMPSSQLQAMVRPALERVQDEITRTFEYYKGQTGEAAINKILITGGSSMTINLIEFLSQGLGIPVVSPAIMDGRHYDKKLADKPALERVLPRLSAAIGAALVGDEKINLMPEEVKYWWRPLTRRFIKPQYLAAIFAVFLLLLYGIFWWQAQSLQKELALAEKKLNEYKPRIASMALIEKAAISEHNKQSALKAHEAQRAKLPKIFEDISRLVPESVFINALNLDQGELQLWGTAL
ncbi:MAG: pilus assembly protein PilM, partial [Candidatus Margulisbacteria bacterium]|nr:pilus assembly protein PilM [Candidatus Margulisiibacteriota bacterium]